MAELEDIERKELPLVWLNHPHLGKMRAMLSMGRQGSNAGGYSRQGSKEAARRGRLSSTTSRVSSRTPSPTGDQVSGMKPGNPAAEIRRSRHSEIAELRAQSYPSREMSAVPASPKSSSHSRPVTPYGSERSPEPSPTAHQASEAGHSSHSLVDIPEEEDLFCQDSEPATEDVYGWAMSMVIRDAVWLHQGTHLKWTRATRVLNSILLILGTNCMQMFLVLGVWQLLCRRQVRRIRALYSEYECHMYPNHTETTVNGFQRGIPGFRVDENFLELDPLDAAQVCEIPLSHPFYLGAILLVWTCTCLVEIRSAFESWCKLIINTPTVASLADVLHEDDNYRVDVEGLTVGLKFFIAGFIEVPHFTTVIILNWLGCRWLTATIGLDDVLLNGIALEFLVLLKELLYKVCVSHRNRLGTAKLHTKPFRAVNKAGWKTFFDAQLWGVLAVLWVFLYVAVVQQVLPHYRWDVHDLCERYSYHLHAKTHDD